MKAHRQIAQRTGIALGVLACATLLSGCAGFVVGTGVGFVVSQQVMPNKTHLAQVRVDVDDVWSTTTDTLSFYVDPGTELEIQDYPRIATAEVGKAKVTVEVEAHDLDRTLIKVQSKKYLANDASTSQKIMDAILERLAPVADASATP